MTCVPEAFAINMTNIIMPQLVERHRAMGFDVKPARFLYNSPRRQCEWTTNQDMAD